LVDFGLGVHALFVSKVGESTPIASPTAEDFCYYSDFLLESRLKLETSVFDLVFDDLVAESCAF
jgi:hypothetical protein